MNFLKRLLAAWKAKQNLKLRQRGKDYANELLKRNGALAVPYLMRMTQESRDFGFHNEFDNGVEETVLNYEQ